MAENKKSFLLYCDTIHTVEGLEDNEAGQLFKHILRYVNDQNPCAESRIVSIAFEPIKQQLKRDLKKWESERGDKSIAGRMGNLKRWNPDLYNQIVDNQINIEDAERIASTRKESHTDKVQSQQVANIAVNVNDTVTDNVIVKKKKNGADKPPFVPPTLLEFKEYFKQNGYTEQLAENAWKGYDVADWHDSQGQKVKSWKQKCQHVWFKEKNKEFKIPGFELPVKKTNWQGK